MSTDVAMQAARHLAGYHDPEALDGTSALPDAVDLVALAGPEALSERQLAAAWRARRGHTPQAVVGMAADGTVALDLVRDGPHALVAGTTGSGKSELLRSLVAGAGARFEPRGPDVPPGRLQGRQRLRRLRRPAPRRRGHHRPRRPPRRASAAEPRAPSSDVAKRCCVRPGSATSPPTGSTRAQRTPGPAGGGDRRVRHPRCGAARLPPRPRRCGAAGPEPRACTSSWRPNGPAGAVSDDIRANTNLRIALRVQDPAESVDVVGTTTASRLPRRRPGRAVVRLGADEELLMQTARVTAAAAHEGSQPVRIRPFRGCEAATAPGQAGAATWSGSST